MEYIWALVLGFIIALILAFGIGANDVANSFGTSVGSKVLTIFQACVIATIFETLGAILIGGQVSDTIRKGIIDVNIYNGSEKLLVSGEISALMGSAVWLIMATFLKLPVSASHSIVGSTLGFSLVSKGHVGIHWEKLGYIVVSWFASPLLSGIISGTIFLLIRKFVLTKKDSLKAGLRVLPYIYAITCGVNLFSIFHNGPKVLRFDRIPNYGAILLALGAGLLIGLGIQFFLVPRYKRRLSQIPSTSSGPLLDHRHRRLLEGQEKKKKFSKFRDFTAKLGPGRPRGATKEEPPGSVEAPILDAVNVEQHSSKITETSPKKVLLENGDLAQTPFITGKVAAQDVPKIRVLPSSRKTSRQELPSPIIEVNEDSQYEPESPDKATGSRDTSAYVAGTFTEPSENLTSFESPVFEPLSPPVDHSRERKLSDADKMFIEYLLPGTKSQFEHGGPDIHFLRFGSFSLGAGLHPFTHHHEKQRRPSRSPPKRVEERHSSFSGTLTPKEVDTNGKLPQSFEDILTSTQEPLEQQGEHLSQSGSHPHSPSRIPELTKSASMDEILDLHEDEKSTNLERMLAKGDLEKNAATSPHVIKPSLLSRLFHDFTKIFSPKSIKPKHHHNHPHESSPPLLASKDVDLKTPSKSEEAASLKKYIPPTEEPDHSEESPKRGVSKLFAFLQILTGAFGAFAHGGNDVSNSIGPLIALWEVCRTGSIDQMGEAPLWILLYGGLGISLGLWLFGKRVMETMGRDLTTITPVSGFTIEIGAALTVLLASNMGIPISTTHCKVGSIVCVGYLRSKKSVDWKLFGNIVAAWIVTVPASVALSAAFTAGLRHIV